MAFRTHPRAILVLALLGSPALAPAANPLGSAVAGAPSLFVLAVVESRADNKETQADRQEREPAPKAPSQTPERAHPTAKQSAQQGRGNGDDLAEDARLTLR